MTTTNFASLDINDIDIDNDGTNDHITIQVSQRTDDPQFFDVRTMIDFSGNGFQNFESQKDFKLAIDIMPGWSLGKLKFEEGRLILLGQSQDSRKEFVSLSKVEIDTSTYVVITSSNPPPVGIKQFQLIGMGDVGIMSAVVKRNLNQIRWCYSSVLKNNPELKGDVGVKVIIDKNGLVSSVSIESSTWNKPEIGSLVEDKLKRVITKFPFPPVGCNEDFQREVLFTIYFGTEFKKLKNPCHEAYPEGTQSRCSGQ